MPHALCVVFFFFNDTATTEIYTLSLHDALPISSRTGSAFARLGTSAARARASENDFIVVLLCRGSTTCRWENPTRSEEHTSELQSPCNLVCRLLLEKKKTTIGRHALSLLRHSNT